MQPMAWVPIVASSVAVLVAIGGVLIAIGMKKQQILYQEQFLNALNKALELLGKEFHQHEIGSSARETRMESLETEVENLRQWRHRLNNEIMGGVQKSVYELAVEVKNLKETVKELKEMIRA